MSYPSAHLDDSTFQICPESDHFLPPPLIPRWPKPPSSLTRTITIAPRLVPCFHLHPAPIPHTLFSKQQPSSSSARTLDAFPPRSEWKPGSSPWSAHSYAARAPATALTSDPTSPPTAFSPPVTTKTTQFLKQPTQAPAAGPLHLLVPSAWNVLLPDIRTVAPSPPQSSAQRSPNQGGFPTTLLKTVHTTYPPRSIP